MILREAAGSDLRGAVEVNDRWIVNRAALLGGGSSLASDAVALRVVGFVSENILVTLQRLVRCFLMAIQTGVVI